MRYYDNKTGEEVSVVGTGLKMEFIRVINPMWLENLSKSDNDVL